MYIGLRHTPNTFSPSFHTDPASYGGVKTLELIAYTALRAAHIGRDGGGARGCSLRAGSMCNAVRRFHPAGNNGVLRGAPLACRKAPGTR